VYRHNASFKGLKVASETDGGIRKSILPSGRSNGGFIGDRRRSTNLASNKDKISGIWPMSGLLPAITTIDEGYYTYPPPTQQWGIQGSTATGYGGKWNVNVDLAACGTSLWPSGPYGGAPPAPPPGYNGRQWTKVGHQGCDGWTFAIVAYYGTYTTVNPPAVWNANNVDYPVWDFFA